MRLDGHGYSPALLQQIVEAAARLKSFRQAAIALGLLAQLNISPRHVGRLTQQVGAELAHERDRKAQQHRQRQPLPAGEPTPEVVAVEVDGGRLRTREPGCGPGVHQMQNKEDKLACLVTLHSVAHEQDPQPQAPLRFRQPRRVARLVQQVRGQGAEATSEDETAADTPQEEGSPRDPESYPSSPKKRVRTCVASMRDSQAFGPLVAGEAYHRHFYQAQRRAFVADGAAYNWTIQRGYFPDFEPICDFLHVLCYLYVAAMAVRPEAREGWALYERWLQACWQGGVAEVISQMEVWQQQLGPDPPEDEAEAQAAQGGLPASLTYLRNNQARMDYPRYRRLGLPVTSSLVESLVGEFNDRVKGRDKYWNRQQDTAKSAGVEGAEAMLQVRAALLSEDDRLARHIANRPGSLYRRHTSARRST